MQVIIANPNGAISIQVSIPDKLWQQFAKGECTEIMWPVDNGPFPPTITMRHDFNDQ